MSKNCFEQICVWQNAPFHHKKHTIDAKESLKLLEHFGYRVEYKDNIAVGKEDNNRTDLFFAIHNDDIEKFSVHRFQILRSTSGRVYGILFSDPSVSVDQQIEFFRQNQVDSMRIELGFEEFFVFSVQLFDISCCEDEELCDEQASKSMQNLLVACKLYEVKFSNIRKPEFLVFGDIRWWEDVVGSMKNTKITTYPPHIMEQFPVRW